MKRFLALIFPLVVFAHGTGVHQIQMTATGFIPQNVEIDLGEIVEFKNVDKIAHWPASNIHPTHQIYPEFDPKGAVTPGASWSFTFEKVGSWRFHDHLFAENTGTVTVMGGDSQSQQSKSGGLNIVAWWGRIVEKLSFWNQALYYKFFPAKLDEEFAKVNVLKIAADEKQIGYWLRLVGPKKVMDKLIADSNGGTVGDCHQEAHLIGRAAYAILGPRAFTQGNSLCHSGFYHGAMEAFLVEKGTENLATNIDNLCNSFPTNFGNFECLHGVGHGVLAYVDYNLPEALKLCQKLSSSFGKNSCYGGIFMENIVVAAGNGAKPSHETKWVSLDPHFPCDAISKDRDVQEQCYYMQTSRMINLFNHDYQRIVFECTRAPTDYIAPCFQSLGRDVAGQGLRSAETINDVCALAPREYFDRCIEGGLNVIIDFWGEALGDQAARLCRILAGAESKGRCYKILGTRIKQVFKSPVEINRQCDFSEESYKGVCLQSAGI